MVIKLRREAGNIVKKLSAYFILSFNLLTGKNAPQHILALTYNPLKNEPAFLITERPARLHSLLMVRT